jgi:hypothetical protein
MGRRAVVDITCSCHFLTDSLGSVGFGLPRPSTTRRGHRVTLSAFSPQAALVGHNVPEIVGTMPSNQCGTCSLRELRANFALVPPRVWARTPFSPWIPSGDPLRRRPARS